MSMTAMQQSRAYVEGRLGWRVIEDTLKVIDAERPTWVSRVSTTHLMERGEEAETTFTLLVQGRHCIEIVDQALDGVVEALVLSQSIVRQDGPSKPPQRV